eukprot:TRINITY_DN4699_c0_g1_i1.p1 TRINITY_DN4699_c0_g1~~TRINITY_DN4699_c0_g1_i1.p1  ORF type:complete len:219 (-),score=39.71 TRINITY_DN4699_c0_g1_i1:137-793(-)
MVHKIIVKTVSNGKERIVELERGALSLDKLKSELQRKTGTKGQWYVRHGTKAIYSDNDLLAAVIEAEKAKEKFLHVEIVGGTAPARANPTPARPVQATSQGRTSTAQPAAQPAAAARPAPTPTPVQDSGVFTSYSVPGVSNGLDKPKVNATPEGRSYVFKVQPAKTETIVEVIVASSKQLQFKLSAGGTVIAQSFNMPFDIFVHQLSMRGDEVVLTFA